MPSKLLVILLDQLRDVRHVEDPHIAILVEQFAGERAGNAALAGARGQHDQRIAAFGAPIVIRRVDCLALIRPQLPGHACTIFVRWKEPHSGQR
jgi:hypothetical protein